MKPVKAQAYELIEGHKYLLVFDRTSITHSDIAALSTELKAMGCESVAVGLAGGVSNMKLVDVTEKNNDATA